MTRIALLIEYDGTAYAGWQRQRNAISVQQCVEEALASLDGVPASVTGASRTDAGVHARGQVVHFDTQSRIPPERYALALNTRLPPDIRIRKSGAVAESFHARYHAVGKKYAYTIYNASTPPAIARQYGAHVPQRLDDEAMIAACCPVLGRHDFTGLCASGSVVRDKVRVVRTCSLLRADDVLTLHVEGNGFLYNMVRIIAGTLIEVGKGKLATDALAQAIELRDRGRAGPTAPAHGLCLLKAIYPAGMLPWDEGEERAKFLDRR